MTNFEAATLDEDLIQIEEMANIIWHEHYTPIIGVEQVIYMLDKFQSVASMSDQIEKGYQYFLILQDKAHVGYLSFVKRDDELFLSKIYILEQFRGQGIGRVAFRFIETKAKENSCKKIGLTVNKYNSNSIRAYERAGFENVGAIVQDIGNNFVMDDYIMQKSL
jgi:RimJ/RimL family protein N-acetyltransferase